MDAWPARRVLGPLLLCLGALAALTGAARADAAVPTCRLGAYVADLYSFDPGRQSVDADIWFWSVCPNKDLEPIQRFEFINTSTSRQTDRFNVQVGNEYWTYAKFVGTYREHLDIAHYPFDRHTLDFVVEATKDITKFVYTPDHVNSTYNHAIRIAGFQITDFRTLVRNNRYTTTFGDPAARPGAGSTYSQFVVRLTLGRADVIGFIKETWPIYVSFLIAMTTFFIELGDVTALLGARLGMLGAALFTIVVNMRATTQSLGTGSGMTLVDQVHAIALLFVLVGVGSTTYSWRVSLGPGGPARALRVNRTVGAIASAGYLAATGSVIAVAVTTG